jgi:quinoprotein glucose dehydrogenase
MNKTIVTIVVGTALLGAVSMAQTGRQAGRDWPYHLGDQGGTRFSTLSQINVSNVATLERAWTFKTGSGRFASAPMVIDSVMYFSAPNGVYAVDAVTGTQIWKYAPPESGPVEAATTPDRPSAGAPAAAGAAAEGPGAVGDEAGRGGLGRGFGGRGGRGGGSAGTALRGPAYWPGTSGVPPRIYSTTTPGLAAIDAKAGTLVTTFGQNGILPGIRPSSPAVFFKNVLVTQGDDEPGKGNTVKGWDVVTGTPLWTFYLKAQPGDPNRATWLGTSAESPISPELWGIFTIDEARGILFIPVEKVGNDYWGGSHHGANLYSDSLVAVDALTGKLKWFRQLVHHDIWDYDIAAPPALIDVRRNGKIIPAVAQYTKMALLFIFNRETGEPIFGMEERPVPQTTAPGEWTSPTQPFPIKPEPLARNSMKQSELAKVTPEHAAYCQGLWEKYKLSDAVPYQPWQVGQDIVVFPGAQGGGNWQGVTFHPSLGLIITNVMTAGQWGHLEAGGGRRGRGGRGAPAPAPAPNPTVPAPAAQGVPTVDAGRSGGQPAAMSKRTPEGGRFWDPVKRWSCAEPPWGELVAVNANTGDIAWRVPLGIFEELEAKGIKTGTPGSGGAISTAGNLVFIGATIDGMFRAFDARSGKMLWSDRLPAPAHSIPSTYMGRDGKQYVVIGATGGGYFGSPMSDEVIAYRLR